MTGVNKQEVGRIAFEALPNTRDLGYLASGSGQQILPQRLIRSGALAEASRADIHTLLTEYNVRTIIDMRTSEEQEKSPDPQNKMAETRFIDAPILGFSATGITQENGLEGMLKALSGLKHDPDKLMCKLYKDMLLDSTGIKGFTRFFEVLANADEGALLWHCSAGKDRAGLASVLLLTVLGVSQSEIVSDYLATNRFLAGRANKLKELVPESLQTENVLQSLHILNSADEAFLNAAITGAEEAFGSLDQYLEEALGVDSKAREVLCNKYLSSSH